MDVDNNNRAKSETFKDPTIPHPLRPNEIACMNIELPSEGFHTNPIFVEHVSESNRVTHEQPLEGLIPPQAISLNDCNFLELSGNWEQRDSQVLEVYDLVSSSRYSSFT